MSVKFGKGWVLSFALLALVALSVSARAQSTLNSVEGRAVNLDDFKGKVVVLSFGGTWVPLASKELPALQRLADRYAARGVQVYWVSINSAKPGARNYASDAELQDFARKNNLRLGVLRDPEQKLYDSYGLDAVPTIVILDKTGKVVRKQVGFGADGEGYGEIFRELDQALK